MRRIFFCVCVVAAAIACGNAADISSDGGGTAAGIPVTVSRAGMRTVTLEMPATGDIRAFAEAAVISEVAGVIESLPVETGQDVEAGDVIAVVEHAEASASVRQAEAALKMARAQVLQAEAALRNADVEHERVRKLFDEGVASTQMLDGVSVQRDIAAAARESAGAQVAQAEAALEQARVFLDNHFIHAPISGVIAGRYVDKGDKNNPSDPIVSIVQLDPVKVVCDFPERDLPLLHVDQSAYVRVDAYPGKRFPARVRIISPCMHPAARTVAVELGAPNADGSLRPGMFARVAVVRERVEMLAVPDDALTRIPGTGAQFVFVVDGGTARRVDVKAGQRAEGWQEVSGEIRPGDIVVVEGQGNLRSGDRVRVVSEPER